MYTKLKSVLTSSYMASATLMATAGALEAGGLQDAKSVSDHKAVTYALRANRKLQYHLECIEDLVDVVGNPDPM